MKPKKMPRIAVIGNYLPRKCGIATFTTDLCNALADNLGGDKNLAVVAMDDIPEGYDYPKRVKFRVRANVQSDYYRAADFLNTNRYEVAVLQHEYGIFGGDDGSYILHMLKALRMPVITNLHTILKEPTPGQKDIIHKIAKYSDRFLVMSHKAIDILKDIYALSNIRIEFVPHGVPDVSFEKPGVFNRLFGLNEYDVILTFGLLSPNKGIENMIKAMPRIVKKHPKVVYVVLGQTHPNVKENEGEAYRHGLQQLVNSLDLQKHVAFHKYFVTNDTLMQYLQTAKVYVMPYLNKEQITSGALAFALGAGAAIVSTPFWYAKEVLSDGRGRLVPFNDPDAISDEVIKLLDDNKQLETMRAATYRFGRKMTHSEVAKQYLKLIVEVKDRRKSIPRALSTFRESYKKLDELPEINLSHLKNMTDDTGILQHAKYNVPDRSHGYCVDDNARALIVAGMYYKLRKDKSILPFLERYLAFLLYAFNKENGRFRNFMSYERKWLECAGSEDCHGRALWSLGIAVKYAPNDGIRNMAMFLFFNALPTVEIFNSPRSWAFTILGLNAYLDKYGGDSYARNLRNLLARRLSLLLKKNACNDWPWFEDTLTYANAKLPHALIVAGQWIPEPEMFSIGTDALKWLLKIQTSDKGHLSVIGSSGWYNRHGAKANFDQQPLEAMNLIDACIDVYISTGDKIWLSEAERCFAWFIGRNDLGINVYNFETGGCSDGLQPDGVNANQGAESTLSWLISLLKMYQTMGATH